MRRDQNGVDILSLHDLAVVRIDVGFLERLRHLAAVLFGLALHPEAALGVNIAAGGHHGVVVLALFLDAHDVVLADAITNADHRDRDAVIRADHPAGGRGLVLPVNRALERVGGGHDSGYGRGFLNERTPSFEGAFRRS